MELNFLIGWNCKCRCNESINGISQMNLGKSFNLSTNDDVWLWWMNERWLRDCENTAVDDSWTKSLPKKRRLRDAWAMTLSGGAPNTSMMQANCSISFSPGNVGYPVYSSANIQPKTTANTIDLALTMSTTKWFQLYVAINGYQRLCGSGYYNRLLLTISFLDCLCYYQMSVLILGKNTPPPNNFP